MDIESIFWYGAFCIGFFLFFIGIFFLIKERNIKENIFAKAIIYEFLASWILFIPEEVFRARNNVFLCLRLVEGIATALLRTFNIYLGNGYELVEFPGHPNFSSIYALVRIFTHISMLLFSAGFVIKFLDGPWQSIKLCKSKKKRIYIFPFYNEKTVSIAKSIKGKDIANIFIITEEGITNDAKSIIERINGGLYTFKDTSYIINKTYKTAKAIEIFLFDDKEENNLIELEKICAQIVLNKGCKTKIFVELLNTPWSLYDNYSRRFANSDNIIINFIRNEECFAYNNLLKTSIFKNALIDDFEIRRINVLIVGINERSLEMFKAVLHLAQMPKYRLSIMLIDDKEFKDALQQLMPEIYEESTQEGDAIYKVFYKENIDFSTSQFEEIITREFNDYTFAFINKGNDLESLKLAVRLNILTHRKNYTNPIIQVCLKYNEIVRDWNPILIEGLTFVGDIGSIYNYNFITMSPLESGTTAIHKVRYPSGTPSWIAYCNNEYNRHSVYARTLSFKHKVDIIDEFYNSDYSLTSKDELWQIYEHMRWNVYTRTLGFIYASSSILDGRVFDNKIRSQCKIHNDLVAYNELSSTEKKQDSLMLTPEIVKILKSL